MEQQVVSSVVISNICGDLVMLKKIWNDLSFRTKMLLLVVLFMSFTGVLCYRYHLLIENLTTRSISETSEIMLDGYKKELKDMVDVMANVLATSVEYVTDEAEVHSIFTKFVDSARFFPDKSGYFFVYRTGGEVFVHATQKNLEKQNLSMLKDPNGNFFIQKLDYVAKAGGGYVEYWWEKPEKGLEPKLSYSRMIPNMDLWIGTGVYIDDIEDMKMDILDNTQKYTSSFVRALVVSLVLGCIGIVFPLTFLLIRAITKPVKELTQMADEFSLGKLNITMPYTDREDEIGKLAKALDRLGVSIGVALQKLQKR